MYKKLILPTLNKDYSKIGIELNHQDLTRGERIYFLAGPIRGGGDWQAKAIQLLIEADRKCHIVCPCRYTDKHPVFKHSVDTTTLKSEEIISFPNQTLWERYYLELASYYGCIIFYLPQEDKLNPRKKEDGPYARDTYGELGRWSVQHANRTRTLNVVIGAEENFSGLSVIKKNIEADHVSTNVKSLVIYSSLEETITEAVKLGKKANP